MPQQGSFADGTPVTYLRHPGRANPAFGRISLFDSGADSIYHGGFVQLSKRFSQNFQVQTSYTFSKVHRFTPGLHLGGGGNRRQQERAGHAHSRTWSAAAAMPTSRTASCSPAFGTSTTASLCRTPVRAQSLARLSVLADRQRAERTSAHRHRGRRSERRHQHRHRPAALCRPQHLHRTQLRHGGYPVYSRYPALPATARRCD